MISETRITDIKIRISDIRNLIEIRFSDIRNPNIWYRKFFLFQDISNWIIDIRIWGSDIKNSIFDVIDWISEISK